MNATRGQVRVLDICRMCRYIIIAVLGIVGLVSGCVVSYPPAKNLLSDRNDTFAFTKYGKGVFFGVNAILRSDTTMILVANQDVFRSTNNGSSWQSLAEPLSHKNITAVAVFHDTIYAGSGHGTVYTSTDHGLQWRVLRRTNAAAIRGFDLRAEPIAADPPASHVWPRPHASISRSDSTIVFDHPAGATRTLTWGNAAKASAIVMSDSAVILAMRNEDLLIYHVDDQRISTMEPRLLTGQSIASLVLYRDTLYVGTKLSSGGVFRVKLGTTSWEQMLLDRIDGALDVNVMYVNDRGVYIATREQGVLAVRHTSNIIRSLSEGIHMGLHQSVSRLDSTWIVSSRLKGALAFDANGGNLRMITASAPSSPEYVVTAMGALLVMGLADGTMHVSSNRGATWQYRSKSFEQSELTSLRTAGSMLYGCAASGLFVSTDTARTFTLVTEALKGENVQSILQTDSVLIVFASSGTYMIDRRGQLALFSPGVKADYQVRINDAVQHNGAILATGYPGLFVSRDAGRTWSLTTIPKAMVLRTVFCDDASVYIVGDDGDIYVSPQPAWLRAAPPPR